MTAAAAAADDDKTALEVVEDEATRDADGIIEVPLGDGDATVRVIAVEDWPSSAQRALREGDSESWAEACLASDDDFKTWLDIDPTMRQVEEFFTVYGKISGQTVGKSRASARISRSTRRR